MNEDKRIMPKHVSTQSATTSMEPHAKELPVRDVINILNGLSEGCKDGQAGFQKAADDATEQPLKQIFTRLSDERMHLASELQSQVKRLGGHPESGGSVGGAIHRGWNNVKSAVGARDDVSILRDCERCEDDTQKQYLEATSKPLAGDIHAMLVRQADTVRVSHNLIRDQRDMRVARADA
ncbi:MAG: PA2169 family four-helix-bundle protein [Myxococcales bacterium]|nr:PA2169 family four-helix-bundle protein [Myxococcales bacterium]